METKQPSRRFISKFMKPEVHCNGQLTERVWKAAPSIAPPGPIVRGVVGALAASPLDWTATSEKPWAMSKPEKKLSHHGPPERLSGVAATARAKVERATRDLNMSVGKIGEDYVEKAKIEWIA